MAKQENRNTLSTSVLVRRFLPYFRKYRKAQVDALRLLGALGNIGGLKDDD